MKSIYLRHFFTTALMILLSFLVLGSAFLGLMFNYLTAETEQQLDSIAYYLAEFSSNNFIYEGRLFFGTTANHQLYASSLGVMGGVTDSIAMTVTADGTVVACSEGLSCSHIGQALSQDVMTAVRTNGKYSGVQTLPLLGQSSMLVARPIGTPAVGVVGAVVASQSMTGVNALLSTFFRFFLMAAVAVVLLSGVLAAYVSRRVTRPLTRIAHAAREFAQGKYDTRIPVQPFRQDEVGQLALAFNAMAESMEKSEQLRRDFIANVSHELRTPMTTIAGYVEGILDGTIPETRQSYYLTVIRDEVHRMNRMVRTMLEIARMQSGTLSMELTGFDICEQCSRTALNLEERITGKGLGMQLNFPKDAVMVRADRDKITQVVSNLLDNAIKFAEPGTDLGLSVLPHGDRVWVRVSNYGPVIPPEDLQHVFDRFHKADRSRGRDKGGLGLGLYIVKTLLSAHGEDIWVESHDGVTAFTFTLRLDDAKLRPAQPPSLRGHE